MLIHGLNRERERKRYIYIERKWEKKELRKERERNIESTRSM